MPLDTDTIRLLPCGDTALTVQLGDSVSRDMALSAVAFAARVRKAAIEGVVECVPTFCSVTVHFEPLRIEPTVLESRLMSLARGLEPALPDARHWRIPVCCEGAYAPDLAEVAQRTGMTPDEVIALHSAQTWFVYTLGFLPGFAYLGDLPVELELPRRATPRQRVPAGSLGIALRLTGLYPADSPGGWHLIGHTPVPLFAPASQSPALLAPGDSVRFEPVSEAEHARIASEVARGEFELRPQEHSP
ncbi:MAG: 5-oxoprolinase subunit PxpB [Pseudomonadota bacterium]|nr:5-oxoprolinase subunit PxpB [Pseudomonadota bacterium]